MRRVSSAIIIWVVALRFAVNVAGEQPPRPPAKPLENPVAATPQSIAAGQASYQKYCRACHGDSGKGDGKMAPKDAKPADFTDATWDHGSTDGDIFRVISEGAPPKSAMKGFKSRLTATEMWNLVNYLRSLQGV